MGTLRPISKSDPDTHTQWIWSFANPDVKNTVIFVNDLDGVAYVPFPYEMAYLYKLCSHYNWGEA